MIEPVFITEITVYSQFLILIGLGVGTTRTKGSMMMEGWFLVRMKYMVMDKISLLKIKDTVDLEAMKP